MPLQLQYLTRTPRKWAYLGSVRKLLLNSCEMIRNFLAGVVRGYLFKHEKVDPGPEPVKERPLGRDG